MSKINAPKFIIGANELASPNKLFLTHTQEPQFIAELIPFEELKEKYPIAMSTQLQVVKGTYFVINVLMIFDSKVYENKQQRADKYSKLMSRAKDWIINYLNTMSDGNRNTVD
jgi:hypothetical protein